MSVESWSERAGHVQSILNELPVPPRKLQRNLAPHVPVVARVEWEHDGVETRETVAYAHAPGMVLVLWHDNRRATIGVWLPVRDVRRV